MAAGSGYLILTQASLRIPTADSAQPAPEIRAPSILIESTASAATVYMSTTKFSNINDFRRFGSPIASLGGKTLTGVPIGTSGFRNIAIGTGLLYFNCHATPANITFSYYTMK